MSSGFKVVWTENSIQDLLTIKEYISNDSKDRAEMWVAELYSSAERLVNLPVRGRIVPECKQENIRELLIDNYRLVYRIKKNTIEIVTVFEGHRKLATEKFKR